MSFTTNGNMHRHMRIHSKETDIEALGTKVRKKTPNYKPKGMFYNPLEIGGSTLNMTTPIPSRDFSPKGLNFGDSTTPTNFIESKGVKRAFDFIDYSQNWSLPKRPSLEEGFSPATLPSHPMSPFIPLVVPQESPKMVMEPSGNLEEKEEVPKTLLLPTKPPVAIRQVM